MTSDSFRLLLFEVLHGGKFFKNEDSGSNMALIPPDCLKNSQTNPSPKDQTYPKG
jgi:hypothetical protein